MKTARIKILICVLIGASGCASAPPVAQAAPEHSCAATQTNRDEIDNTSPPDCCFTVSELGIASDSEDNLHRLIIPFVPGYREKRIRERVLRDRDRCLEAAASAPK